MYNYLTCKFKKQIKIIAGLMAIVVSSFSSGQNFKIHSAQPIDIKSVESYSGSLSISFSAYGKTFDTELTINEELLSEFKDGSFSLDQIYKGTLKNNEDSWVRLSFVNGRWTGAIHDGTELYLVDNFDTLKGELTESAVNEMKANGVSEILVKASDMERIGGCGMAHKSTGNVYGDIVTALEQDAGNFTEEVDALQNGIPEATRQLNISIVTDTEFNNRVNGDPQSEAIALLNVANGIFDAQINLQLGVEEVRVLSDNGTLTSTNASNLLGAFRTYTNNQLRNPGLTHLFTGKDMDGGTVGIAYLSAACGSSGNGVSEALRGSSGALIITHEIGHNLGAPHDNQSGSACASTPGNFIMNPSINGSREFSQCSRDQMNNFLTRANCLVDPGPTPTPSPTPNPIACEPGALNLENTQDYSSSNTGEIFIDANGCTAYLSGNIWQITNDQFEINANTIVEFDFASNGRGEIIGVGFDENTEASADRVFQLGGSQSDWGITNFSYTGNGEFQTFSIPVGEFFTGSGFGFVIANDKDEGAQDNQVTVSNVIITSGINPTPSPTPTPSLTPTPTPTNTPTPTPIECVDGAVNLSSNEDYSSASTGEVFVDANGCTAYLSGNIWRITTEGFTITENTVVEFEFATNGTGEIQGVGFDEDTEASADRIFQLAGSQDWGILDFRYTGNGEFQSFSIPVGNFFTGPSLGFVLANDKDEGTADNTISVSNLVIRELATPTPTPTPSPSPTPAAPTPTPTPPVDADWFFIVHKPTGSKLHSCSEVDLTPIATRPNANAGPCVQWRQIPNGEFFHIQNRRSEKYVKPDTAENGSPISVVPNTWVGNWTQWRYESTNDGFGYLINRATGKLIHRNAQANTLIRQQPSSWRGDFTRWQFEAAQ